MSLRRWARTYASSWRNVHLNVKPCRVVFVILSIEQAAFARLRRAKEDSSIHLAHRLANAKISPHNLFRRGGTAVDRAGLEIRFEDFGLNWTQFATTCLVFRPLHFLTPSRWTIVVTITPICFLRVTFLVYLHTRAYLRIQAQYFLVSLERELASLVYISPLLLGCYF